MTDRERYKKAFGNIHAPEDLSRRIMNSINERTDSNNGCKVIEMNGKKKFSGAAKRAVAGLVAAFVLVAGAGTAYAANVGGIQRTVQIWANGDQTDAVLEIETPDENGPYSYTLHYTDENGEEHEMGGGGLAVDMFGHERPLTEEEIMEHIMMPDVYTDDDGRMYVCSLDQKMDITDMFGEDGICYITVTQGKINYYMVINKDSSYSMSTTSYPKPDRK